jgi:hypothetical protein
MPTQQTGLCTICSKITEDRAEQTQELDVDMEDAES